MSNGQGRNTLALFRPTTSLSIFPALLMAGALCALVHTGDAGAQIDRANAQRVDITMVDYEFVPEEVRLRRDVTYRLHLVNAGREGHDFTAPDFFSAVEIKEATGLNESRSSVFVRPGQTTDVYLVARQPGVFELRCADHDWAGMTATILVE